MVGVLYQRIKMRIQGTCIAACHGTGQRAFATRKRVIDGRTNQRTEVTRRVFNTDTSKHLLGLSQKCDEMVRGMRQCGVIKRTIGFGNVDGLTAHFNDERLSYRDKRHRPGHGKARTGESL